MHGQRFSSWNRIRGPLCGLFLCMLPVVAWARAGGGGGFGGGGGGGGSGGGGGGGGGEAIGYLIYLLLRLCIHQPLIGIPLVLFLGYLLYRGSQESREGYMSHVIHREARRQKEESRLAAIAEIKRIDPDFHEEHFLERASEAFLKIQEAWSQQEMTPARAFISDGIHQRFSLQIEMQKAEGFRNVMEHVKVVSTDSMAVYANDQFDTIHVGINARAVDYDVNLKTNSLIRGSNSAEAFTEVWSFHRRHGAKTLHRSGSIEGNCPSCAAPLEIQDRAECAACGSVVNSGEHDWVLAEITQVGEWSLPETEQSIPGLQKIQAADPAFSVQHLEDRASVMFYRLNAATFFNDLGYATPVLSGRLDGLPSRAALPDEQFWKDPAVGKVQVLNIQQNEQQTHDQVRVLIRWSGRKLEGDPAGRTREITSQAIYSHVYVLSRDIGIKSDASRTFSSSSCTSCGGPIAVSSEPKCSFCGHSLTDGKHDWVLEEIEAFRHDLAYRPALENIDPKVNKSLAVPSTSGVDPTLMLAVLARVVSADGHVDEKERRALNKLARHNHLSEEDVDRALESAKHAEIELPIPTSPVEARRLLQQMIHVCLMDGRFTTPEKQLVVDVAKRLDYSNADIKMMIAREKRALYQAARKRQRL